MKNNTVKSIVERNGNLVVRFFDNTGSLKQKSLGLSATKSNRNRVWKEIVPAFEDGLRKQEEESLKVKIPLNFGFYSEKYLQQLIANKHTKLIAHSGRITTMLNHFGTETNVNTITELSIEEFFQGLTCRRATKIDWLVVMRGIFEKARKGNALEKNIAERFKLPSEASEIDHSAVEPFSVEEIRELLFHSKGTILHNYLGIAFHLGTRPEETIALQIKDINLSDGIVRIERAITKGQCKTPKTKGSIRSIPLPDQAKVFFTKQIEEAVHKNTPFLFSNDDGVPLNDIEDIRGRKSGYGAWYQLLDKSKVPHRKLMQTRHTFAVQAIKLGTYTLQEIASILGHTSLAMIIEHYGKNLGASHLKVSRSINIFEGLGDIMGDIGNDDSIEKVA